MSGLDLSLSFSVEHGHRLYSVLYCRLYLHMLQSPVYGVLETCVHFFLEISLPDVPWSCLPL